MLFIANKIVISWLPVGCSDNWEREKSSCLVMSDEDHGSQSSGQAKPNGAGERAREQSSERADADHEHVECGEAATQRRVERARLVQMLRAAQCAPQRHVCRGRRVARRHARAAHTAQRRASGRSARAQYEYEYCTLYVYISLQIRYDAALSLCLQSPMPGAAAAATHEETKTDSWDEGLTSIWGVQHERVASCVYKSRESTGSARDCICIQVYCLPGEASRRITSTRECNLKVQVLYCTCYAQSLISHYKDVKIRALININKQILNSNLVKVYDRNF